MDDEQLEEGEEQWCAEQRENVVRYLATEELQHGEIGDWPAWHVFPYISIWAIESSQHPGWVGLWVVSGDFPTDYTTCHGERHPRQALRDIGIRWRNAAESWSRGEPAYGWGLGSAEQERELAPLLSTRATFFLELAADESHWLE